MKRFLIAASTSAFLASGAAYAQDNMINEADVVVELEDAENANALEYWPKIEADLEEVFAAYIAPVQSGDGYDVRVRLTEVSLSGSKKLAGQGEFNHMEGWVYVREQGEPSVVDSFKVIIDAETMTDNLRPGDFVILPNMDDFYIALLNGFADKSVRSIGEIGS